MKTKTILSFVFVCLTGFGLIGQQTIYDIQFTENAYGESPYINQEVSVTGIVTSSAQDYDLGYVFIQDEGGGPWSGIWLTGSGLTELYRNEEITVSGTVIEKEGVTQIDVSSVEHTGNLKETVVSDIDPADSSAHEMNGFEKWESVLVRYKSSNENKLYISHPKVNPNNDFGDFAISTKTKSINKKLGLILTGRQTSNIISSLWVQIVNDLYWYDNSGQMQVSPIVASNDMEMDAVKGIMFYGYGDYRLLPRNNDDFENINIDLEPTDLAGSPLSLEEYNRKAFRVFPNPASNYICAEIAEEIAMIRIFDLKGNLVFLQNQKPVSNTINISSLNKGTYLIQVKTIKNELISSKIVLKK